MADDPYDKPPQLFDETGDAMAFGYGMGHGFQHVVPRPRKHRATAANPYYYYPGYVVGYLLKVGALVAMATYVG